MDFIKDHKPLIVIIMIDILLAGFTAFIRGGITGETLQETMTVLSDMAMVPGTLTLGIGIIIWVTNKGFFDGVKYGFKNLKKMGSQKHYDENRESFYDYKTRMSKAELPCLQFMAVGAVVVVLAVIFAFFA